MIDGARLLIVQCTFVVDINGAPLVPMYVYFDYTWYLRTSVDDLSRFESCVVLLFPASCGNVILFILFGPVT